ncbi:MAG: hypothetical protein EU544_04785 [Promethearchaeota archaeon]|nr:MAG: hypothetical protein EU544_04785 [Candidatus Lokiarchaeota archaeon]
MEIKTLVESILGQFGYARLTDLITDKIRQVKEGLSHEIFSKENILIPLCIYLFFKGKIPKEEIVKNSDLTDRHLTSFLLQMQSKIPQSCMV